MPLEHPFAALVNGVAAAFLNLHEQILHTPDLFYPGVKLRQFLARQLSPALGNRRSVPESEEKLPDFIQAKARLTRPLDDCQPIKRASVIPSLTAHALRRLEDSDLFVVADCRCANPNLPRHFGNGHLRHARIIAEFYRNGLPGQQCWDQSSKQVCFVLALKLT